MSKANIQVQSCLQDIHDGSVMLSKVFFSIQYNGKIYDGLEVEISHNYGIDYSVDPLEVHNVTGIDIKLDYGEFSDGIERYYRKLVGANGSMINFGPESHNIRMMNNMLIQKDSFDVNVVDTSSGAW